MIYGAGESENDEDESAMVARDFHVNGLNVPYVPKTMINAYWVCKKELTIQDLQEWSLLTLETFSLH